MFSTTAPWETLATRGLSGLWTGPAWRTWLCSSSGNLPYLPALYCTVVYCTVLHCTVLHIYNCKRKSLSTYHCDYGCVSAYAGTWLRMERLRSSSREVGSVTCTYILSALAHCAFPILSSSLNVSLSLSLSLSLCLSVSLSLPFSVSVSLSMSLSKLSVCMHREVPALSHGSPMPPYVGWVS